MTTLRRGMLVSLKVLPGGDIDDRNPAIGIIINDIPDWNPTKRRPKSSPDQILYQVYWSAGSDTQFHVDECWIEPAYLEEIPYAS